MLAYRASESAAVLGGKNSNETVVRSRAKMSLICIAAQLQAYPARWESHPVVALHRASSPVGGAFTLPGAELSLAVCR